MANDNVNPYESPQSDASEMEGSARSSRNHDKLITLATFDNPYEAHLLCNELRSAGIDASVTNETSTAVMGATIVGPSRAFWIEVVIKECDSKAALLIKEQFLSSDPGEEPDIPQWKCTCGETVDAGFAVCWNCEAEYGE